MLCIALPLTAFSPAPLLCPAHPTPRLQNRARFPSIDNRELDSRRGFVTDAKTSLSQSDEHIKRISQKASQAGNKRKVRRESAGDQSALLCLHCACLPLPLGTALNRWVAALLLSLVARCPAPLLQQLLHDTPGGSRFQSSANAEAGRGNDEFVHSSRQSALAMEAQQDVVMDDMAHALDRLTGIGQTINQQLVESEHQLGGLDEDLDTAQLSMDNALRKMDKLLKSSDKGRLCLIVVLFILAVGLFFGVVYG